METPVSAGTLVATMQVKEGTNRTPETAGLQQEQKGRHSIVGTPATSTSNRRDVNRNIGTSATAPIAKVLKTEIERIHVQKNKDTSGQPAADNSSNEESTTGTQAIAGMPATAGRQ